MVLNTSVDANFKGLVVKGQDWRETGALYWLLNSNHNCSRHLAFFFFFFFAFFFSIKKGLIFLMNSLLSPYF